MHEQTSCLDFSTGTCAEGVVSDSGATLEVEQMLEGRDYLKKDVPKKDIAGLRLLSLSFIHHLFLLPPYLTLSHTGLMPGKYWELKPLNV